MANKASIYLSDKDIRQLQSKETKCEKTVGEPKELCIWVNPTGIKTFFVKFID